MTKSKTTLTFVVLGVAIASNAFAQSPSRPRSPRDVTQRLLDAVTASTPTAPNQSIDPDVVWNAMSLAIDVLRGIEGERQGRPATTRDVPSMASAIAVVRASRANADSATAADDWTRALTAAIGAIESVGGAATCTDTVSTVSGTTFKTLLAGDTWRNSLGKASCELQKQLRLGWKLEGDSPTARAADYLPFAGFMGGNAQPQVTIQAADLYFSNTWRLYVRSTVQATDSQEKTEATDDATDDAKKVDDQVRSAMLDPFGGALNIAAGFYKKVQLPWFDGRANDAEHGVFFDTRAGMKLIQLPEQTLTLTKGPSNVTPFYAGIAGLRLRLPLFNDHSLRARAGDAEMGLVVTTTGVFDRTASALFTGTAGKAAALPTRINALHMMISLQITDVANVAINGTLKSNTKLDKRVAVELNLVKPKADAKKTEAPTAPATPATPAAPKL